MKALLTVLACFGTSLAFAQAKPCEWYRFESDDGVVVLAYSIPPSLVHKGYSCIDKDGNTIKEVERELTADEIARRDAEIAKKKAEEAAGVARARKDQELTKLYASARDVEEARDRKVLSIETAMATTKSNIERLKLQKQRMEEQAANREREGLAPSPDILENLKSLETQISDKETEVASRKIEKQQVLDQFALDLERIKMLYGVAPAEAAKGATAPAGEVPRKESAKKEAAKNDVPPANVTATSESLH